MESVEALMSPLDQELNPESRVELPLRALQELVLAGEACHIGEIALLRMKLAQQ